MKKTTLGIITINYNRLDDTLELLESLSKAIIPKGLTVKIYVIDNNSIDKPNAVIHKKFPTVNIINTDTNLGFTGGNNLGINRGLSDSCNYLVLINNDCFVGKDFYEKILASPISDPKVGIVSGLIYFAPGFEFEKGYLKKDLGKVIWYGGGFFDWANVLGSHRFVNQVDDGKLQTSGTDFVSGALLITKSDVIKKIGLFDDRYFLYLEDADLCRRVKLAGFQLMFDPRIKIWHKVAGSSGIGSPLNDYYITRNRLLFGSLYTPPRTRFALFREALRKLLAGTPAQKRAIIDYFSNHLGKGSFVK